MNPRILYLGGFVITAGYISYQEIRHCGELPWPPRIIATGFVFGMLELFSGFSPELSGIIALGFGLAMIVNTRLQANTTLCAAERKGCGCGTQVSAAQIIPGAPEALA